MKFRRKLNKTKKYFAHIDIFIDYWLEKLHSIFIVIWRKSCNHLMNQATKTPPVYVNTMSHFLYDFRSKIFRCTTNWHGNTVLTIQYFRKPKISQLDISLMIDNDIFGFQTKLHKNSTLCKWSCFYGVIIKQGRFLQNKTLLFDKKERYCY